MIYAVTFTHYDSQFRFLYLLLDIDSLMLPIGSITLLFIMGKNGNKRN